MERNPSGKAALKRRNNRSGKFLGAAAYAIHRYIGNSTLGPIRAIREHGILRTFGCPFNQVFLIPRNLKSVIQRTVDPDSHSRATACRNRSGKRIALIRPAQAVKTCSQVDGITSLGRNDFRVLVERGSGVRQRFEILRKIARGQRGYLGAVFIKSARKHTVVRKFIQRVVLIRTLSLHFGFRFAFVGSSILSVRSLLLGPFRTVRHLVGARSILTCIFARIGGGGRNVILRRARLARGIATSFRRGAIRSAIATSFGGSIDRCRQRVGRGGK